MTAVRIPPVLRAQAGNNKKVEVTGATVGAALESLLEQYPSLREQVFTDDGALNRFVNVYVNGRDVRYEQELETPVGESDEVIQRLRRKAERNQQLLLAAAHALAQAGEVQHPDHLSN